MRSPHTQNPRQQNRTFKRLYFFKKVNDDATIYLLHEKWIKSEEVKRCLSYAARTSFDMGDKKLA